MGMLWVRNLYQNYYTISNYNNWIIKVFKIEQMKVAYSCKNCSS